MSDKVVLLVHGGLYEPVDAKRFWVDTGVVDEIEANDVRVLAPDRLLDPMSWQDEAAHIVGEAGLAAASSLLSGETVRGVADDELKALAMPVSVMAAVPISPIHQQKTVAGLVRLIPDARSLPGFPETPLAAFPPRLAEFVEVVLSDR